MSGGGAPVLPAAAPASPAAAKEKRSFSKRLLFRGRGAGAGASSARSLGGFVSRVLKTLSTLSHLGSEHGGAPGPAAPARRHSPAAAALSGSGLGRCFQPSPEPEPPPSPPPAPEAPGPPPPASPAPPGPSPVPGVAGLRNHGNTCFMNAVLQCLSNTELFAEFLALEQYRAGARGGSEAPPPAGTAPDPGQGEVTEQLAQLVRALWTLEYTPQLSREFKELQELQTAPPPRRAYSNLVSLPGGAMGRPETPHLSSRGCRQSSAHRTDSNAD